jgi:ribosomal protein S18 acetylase RimI-like enzyme
MNEAIAIEPARPSEQAEAFRLAFQHVGAKEQANRVSKALELLQKKELDPDGIVVARSAAGLVGAVICMPTPGAGGLIWPPQVRAGGSGLEDQLVQHACAWLRARGAKLAQAMLTAEETQLAAALPRNGFVHTTALCYLRLDVHEATPQAGSRLTYQSYQSHPDLFQQTLLETYERTEDCPELTGVRSIEEIIEGHRAQGASGDEAWWLARCNSEVVGVLLLARLIEWDGWDVAYVGVRPQARRQGHGRQLMHKAIAEAQRRGGAQLTLSVDKRNRPAWKLYESLGFSLFDEREVFLALWGPDASAKRR